MVRTGQDFLLYLFWDRRKKTHIYPRVYKYRENRVLLSILSTKTRKQKRKAAESRGLKRDENKKSLAAGKLKRNERKTRRTQWKN